MGIESGSGSVGSSMEIMQKIMNIAILEHNNLPLLKELKGTKFPCAPCSMQSFLIAERWKQPKLLTC